MNEIDTSKASREFDAWIAEKVMKWKMLPDKHYHGCGGAMVAVLPSGERRFMWHLKENVYSGERRWSPTTDDGTAFAAVHCFLSTHAGYGFALRLDWHGPEGAMSGYAWASFVPHDPKFGAYARTVPLAICKAIHKVLTSPCEAPQS